MTLQHESFVFDGLDGRRLERFVGSLTDAGEPLVLLLKAEGVPWQRFYLDAGIHFWGETTDEKVSEELAEYPYADYGMQFGIVGDRLGVVRGDLHPRITIPVTSGEVIFEELSIRVVANG